MKSTIPKLIRISTVPVSLNILLKGQLKFLSAFFEVIGVSSPGEDLKNVAEREGCRIFPITIKRSISPLSDFISLIRLYLFFKKEKPQIVHSITPKAGLLSMLAAKLAGVPIRMHTYTGLIFPGKTGILQKVLIFMDRLLCKAATNIYPEGQGVKNDLIRFKITSKPLKILANGNVNGIDLDYFSNRQVSEEEKIQLRKELKLLPADFVFIFVGRLVKDKGINELVTAFANLNSPRLKLLLVGHQEAKLDPLSGETIKEIERNQKILAVGFQQDVRPYLAIADVLVFPSYREGFPNTVMQAGAMDLPSIVTDINGSNEIIREGENGIIIPPRNAVALQEAMYNIWQDKVALQQMKNSSRRMVAERYGQELVWSALLEEYKRLIPSD